MAEGLFYHLADSVAEEDAWKWPNVQDAIMASLAGSPTAGHFMERMTLQAKQSWDKARRDTGGRVYKAHPLTKLAESFARSSRGLSVGARSVLGQLREAVPQH